MNKVILLVLLGLTITSAAIFYPNKRTGLENQQAKFESYGYNYNGRGLASDRGIANIYMQNASRNREPALIQTLEQRAEKLPGVVDLKILSYTDSLIVGVLTDGRNRVDIRNTTVDVPHTPTKPGATMLENTDGYHKRIIRTLRASLQAQSSYNNIFITTNPAMYERIAELHKRIHEGKKISNEELQVLVNDIGYTTRGYNLID